MPPTLAAALVAGLAAASSAQVEDIRVFDGANLTSLVVGTGAYSNRTVPVYSNGRNPGVNLTFFGALYDVLDEVDFTGGLWDGVSGRVITEMSFGIGQFAAGATADLRYEFYNAADLDGAGPFGTAYTNADMLGTATPFFTQTFATGASGSGIYSWFTNAVNIPVPDGVNRIYIRFSVLNPGTTNIWTGLVNAWVPGFSNDLTVGGGLTNFAMNSFNIGTAPFFTGNPNPGRGDGCANPTGQTQEHRNWANPPACRTIGATGGKGMYMVLSGNGTPVCPTVESQPMSQAACEGGSASFSAGFSGGVLALQWRRNGVDIPGATSSTFSIATLVAADAGSYVCVATNACGSVTTNPATLTIGTPPAITTQPQARPLIPGATATISVAATGSDIAFQWRRDGTPLASGGRISGATNPTLTITSVASTDQGAYDCVITGPCGMATSAAVPLACTPTFTLQPQGGSYSGGSTITLAAIAATAGTTTYRWRKNGATIFNSQTYTGVSTPTLTILANDPNDSGSYTLAVTNACGTSISNPAAIDVSCLSDFNLDGGVDGDDLFAFFGVWQQGTEAADVNQDGGVDFGDVATFFEKWEAGC